MATANKVHIKSECLLQELEIWRFAVTQCSNLFNKDAFLKDILSFKIDISQGFIEELHSWEEIGNETKCKNAIDNIEFFFGQIQVLFDSMFADQNRGTGQDMEDERIFTDHILVS